MKAAQIREYGSYEKIIIADTTQPDTREGQIVVKVAAASINPFDFTVMSGKIPIPLPLTVGGDFAGTVESIALGVTGYNIGDEVYGQAVVANGGSGSLAEYTSANAKNMAQKPQSLTMVEAAALPLTGASAVQALEEHIKITRGTKLLIHGGAGGIGTIAIQLAHMYGAHIATTVSKEAASYVQALGADEVIDYKSEDFTKRLHDYDAVYDTVGGDTTAQSLQVLKNGGILVTMIGQLSEKEAIRSGITFIKQMTHTDNKTLTRLAELVELGKIKPHIDKSFPLTETQNAYRYFVDGHPKGKVIVTVSS